MPSEIVPIIGFIGNIVVLGGYLPQIFKTWKTRKAEDISIMMWIWYFLGDLLLLIYSVMTNDPVFIVLFAFFTLGNAILIILTKKYGRQSPPHKIPAHK